MIIIADDLTGAADCGVKFSEKGISTEIVFHNDETTDSNVAVYSTDSRSMSVVEAQNAVNALAENCSSRIFKKIDSTMRGHVGAELEALLEFSNNELVFLCPALPLQGRTVKDGICFINELKIAESVLAKDPLNPVNESEISKILAQETLIQTSAVKSTCTKSQILKLYNQGIRIFSFDAESDEDLSKIVNLAAQLPLKTVLAGSSGLAAAVAENLVEELEAEETSKVKDLPLLIVSGSVHETTQRQIQKLLESGYIPQFPISELVDISTEVVSVLSKEKSCLLYTCKGDSDKVANGQKLIQNLANTVQQISDSTDFQLVIVGGETAREISRHLGIGSMHLLDEIEPGVPRGLLKKNSRVIPVITKSGGFGTDETLINIYKKLRGENFE